jgi:hypothetical protein
VMRPSSPSSRQSMDQVMHSSSTCRWDWGEMDRSFITISYINMS